MIHLAADSAAATGALQQWLLPSLIGLPLLGALLILLFPSKRDDELPMAVTGLTLFTLFAAIISAIFVHGHGESLAVDTVWMQTDLITLRFSLDLVDGLSTTLVLLTALLMPICILVSVKAITTHRLIYYASLLVLEAGMMGTFLATDLFTFYICWESVLIPMTILIGLWGSSNRLYASLKLFLYTMLGSLPMLAALLAVSWQGGRFETDLAALTARLANGGAPEWAFWCMAIAFAIKLPLVPLHTWLPDAHTEAPTAGSVVLAGVMLKMGTYGFLRLAFPFFPDLLPSVAPTLAWIACIGIVWGSLMAMAQTDIKRLIAYSSVAHLGTCMLGIFALNELGVIGGQLQMINHGISTGLLFLVFGMLYERGHVRDIAAYGGLARKLPLLTIAFFIATFASVGLPATNGFVGEFLVLMGAFEARPVWGIIACSGVVLGAVYMLRLCRMVFFGAYKVPVGSEEHMHDLTAREVILLLPLIALVFIIGLQPDLVIDLLPVKQFGFIAAN